MNIRVPLLLALCWIGSTLLLADGGVVLFRKQAGPFNVTVFSASGQLTTGANDISVMVQRTSDNSNVDDACIGVRLAQSTPDKVSEVFAPATHAKATNKLLYAAALTIPATGASRLIVQVDGKSGSAEVAQQLIVAPPQPPLNRYWLYIALVPVLLVSVLMNRWLKRRRLARNRPRQP